MADSIDHRIYLDLANEAVRDYGELPGDFPQKMARRFKRKFHTSLDTATILNLAGHFKKIYGFGSSIIRNFITTKGVYASLEDIRFDDFMKALAGQYPEEDPATLKTICDWLVYYEYLR